MTAPEKRVSETIGNELRSSVPAAVIMLLVAYLLRFTAFSLGVRLAASFFMFVVLQAFFRQQVTGERIPRLGWVFTLAVAFISALAMWFIGNL